MSQQINLYNPLFEKKQKPFSARAMVQSLGFIAVALGVLCVYAALQARAVERIALQGNAQLTMLRNQVAALVKMPIATQSGTLQAEMIRLERELELRRSTLRALGTGELGNAAGFSEFFAAFGRQAVPGVWLTAITIGDSGNDLVVRGRALRPELMSALLRGLSNEPIMRGRKVVEMKIAAQTASGDKGAPARRAGEPESFVEFSVAAPLQIAEAPPSSRTGKP